MNDITGKNNRRILVIDDTRSIHEDFRKILAMDTIAESAMDASEAALFGKPTNAAEQPG